MGMLRRHVPRPRTAKHDLDLGRRHALRYAVRAMTILEDTMAQLAPADPLRPVLQYHIAMWNKLMGELAR